jgi:hypothetical protein
MELEKPSMTVLVEKLSALGGSGPLKAREWRIRCRLNWHDKAASAVRHLLYRERCPTIVEAREIEAAHARYCAERIRANAAENQSLISSLRSALAAMETTDPAFFEPTIESVRAILLQRWAQASEPGGED